ncbi:MAG TPA: hypothetical protein VM890_15520 [Longimicrobium sp.]|nr:hypothetical protein [Longimicrobium sp.]
MSDAAVRAPAPLRAVARHYLRLLANGRLAVALLIIAGVALLGSVNARGFEGLASVLWLMALLPLLHWGPGGGSSPLDQAMPVDRARHDLVRTACGAAWAAAALAAAIGPVSLLLYASHHGRPGAGFWWYPPLLIAVGVAYYVVGAAAWLRRGSFVALYCTVYASATLPLVIPGLARTERLLSLRDAPSPGEPLRWIGGAILVLAAAAGAAWLSAIAPRGRAAGIPGLRPRTARSTATLRRRAPPRGAADAPRRPAPFRVAFWREVVLLRPLPSAAVVLLMAGWLAATGGESRRGNALFSIVLVLPLFWPMVVWRVGTSPRLARVEPLPASDVARQMARLAAGAGVLLLTLLPVLALGAASWPGTVAPLPVEEWAGLLSSALLLYLLASLPAITAGEHRGGWSTGWLFFLLLVGLPLIRLGLPRGTFSPGSALAALFAEPGPPAAAVVLWTAIFAALAARLAAAGVNAERRTLGPSAR